MRALFIALLAALVAWYPMVEFVTVEDEAGPLSEVGLKLLGVALLGSFALGLPIALLVYWLAGKSLSRSPGIVFMIANLAGAMMMLASFVLADEFGMLMLGVPSWIAANVYAGLGWLWILKPMREDAHA